MTLPGLETAPATAPLLSIGGAALVAALPAARPDGLIASVPVLLGAAVLGAAASASGAAAFEPGPLASGAAIGLALLGATAALAIAAVPAGSAASSGRRLRSARAVPPLVTGLAVFAVRLADPALVLLALLGVAVTVGAAAGLGRGVDAAAAAFRSVIGGTVAVALALGGLALAAVAPGVTGAPLALGGTLLALAALLGLVLDGAPARVLARTGRPGVAPLAPLVLLALPVAAFPLLLRLHAGLPADGRALADPVLGAAGFVVLLAAARSASGAEPALAAGRLFVAVALVATGCGGTASALLALCAAIGAVPALAFPVGDGRWSRRLVGAAACGLPPAGGFAALALALDATASRAAIGPALLLLALIPVAGGVLRGAATAPPAPSLPARCAGLIHLLALFALGLLPSRTLSDGLLAAAELINRGPT